MKKITLMLLQILFFCTSLSAQQTVWWKKSSRSNIKKHFASKGGSSSFSIDNESLEAELKNVNSFGSGSLVSFPTKAGVAQTFVVSKTSILHPKLAKKYPDIHTYVGYHKDNPRKIIRFSYNPLVGMHGNISSPENFTEIIVPIDNASISFYRAKSEQLPSNFNCLTPEIKRKANNPNNFQQKNANDGNLRRYRLALSTSGEYSQYFLDGSESSDAERKSKVLTAMVTSINRVNGIFERDFNITMQIIPESDELIFLNPSSDPYNTEGNLNGDLQRTIDSSQNISPADYDVGHLFLVDDRVYGNAGCIACVCTDSEKGSAFTAHNMPDSENFNMIVAHEFGHQFGGYHVQSSSNCRSGVNSEVEPGSGSTIMGYAGICPANVQDEPDDYFNYVDIRDVAEWTINNSNCAEIIPTGNTAPDIEAGQNYTIPIATPFVLEGTATDVDNSDLLTYCWEQNNPEDPLSSDSPQSNWTVGPLFRSLPPSVSPKRYFPKLESILEGSLYPTWEVLPSVSRAMRFEMTVRDNVIGGGQSSSDGVNITSNANAGPFIVLSQDTPEIWNVGEEVTINWDVANTNLAPINAQQVNILLSVDGGYTYPITLLEETPNDGTETFLLPFVESSSNARLMVKASDNIFFSINESNITTQASEFSIGVQTPKNEICEPNSTSFTIDYKTYLGFDETVNFSVLELPTGFQAEFTPPSISGNQSDGTTVELSISGTENLDVGNYSFQVQGNSDSGVRKSIQLDVYLYDDSISASSLISPAADQIGFDLRTPFQWSLNENTAAYELEVASDIEFTNIEESILITENSYIATGLTTNTAYFWRIRNTNDCSISSYSEINAFTTRCSSPEEFRTTAIGPGFVTLDWDDPNTTQWEIEYGNSGFTLGNGTVLSVLEVPFSITELDSSTAYDFYLRSTCDLGGEGIDTDPITVLTSEDFCNGDRFYDSGGVDGNYSNNEDYIKVIRPGSAGERIRASFQSFSLENCCDQLMIYDGPDTSAPYIGSFGFVSPGQITSTHESGALTFIFHSDSSITSSGWEAIIYCEPKPNCGKPTNFNTDIVTARSATFNWDADENSTSWDIEYGLQGFGPGTGTIQNNTETTAVISGLSAVTSYDVYLRANCTIGGVSDMIGPLTITTSCDVIEAPFLESFADFNTPECWMESGTERWVYDTYANYDARLARDRNRTGNTNYAWIQGFFTNAENDIATLLTPFIETSTLSNPSFQFSVFSKNTIDNTYNTLEVEFYDGASWNMVLQLQENTGGWKDIVVDLADYTITGPIQIRFRNLVNSPGDPQYNNILIDEIKVDELPTCFNPFLLEATEIKGTSAEITWMSTGNESNWEIQYGPQGFSPANATSKFVTTTSTIIDGLEPRSNYDVYVRALCGIADHSELIGPVSLITGCDVSQSPFVENFSSFYRPQCWQENPTSNWNFQRFSINNDFIPDRTSGRNTNYAYKYYNYNGTSTPSYLTSPYINVSNLTIPTVKFSVYSNEVVENEYNNLLVEFFDGENWNELLDFAGETEGWRDFYFDVSSYVITDDIQVRFGITDNSNGGFHYILIDEVQVVELPTCFTPYDFTASSIGSDQVELLWNAGENETDWDIIYGSQGFNPENGTTVSVLNNTESSISGLEPVTTYDFYIQSNCGNGDYSELLGPITITTICGTYASPFEEVFEEYTIPICWEDQNRNYWNIGKYYDFNSRMEIPDHTDGRQTNYLFKERDFNGTDADDYLITPKLNISNLVVPSLQMAIYSNSVLSSQYNTLTVDFYDGEDWNTLLTSSEATSGWKEYYFDLSSYEITGDVQVRFNIQENLYSNEFNYILIDDIKIQELPACFNPSELTVESSSANDVSVSWFASGGETDWQLEYGERNFLIGNGTRIDTQTNLTVLTQLQSNTNYDIYVRAVCSADDYSDWSEVTMFKTATNFCGGDRFYDSGGVNGSYSDNENETTVIVPADSGDRVRIIFDSFNTEGCCDELLVYDGPNTSAPFIGSYSGNNSPGEIRSTHNTGTLTFVFRSDGSITSSGWEARVICESNLPCEAPENITFLGVSSTEVIADWTGDDNGEIWELEYGEAGFTPGFGINLTTDSKPFALNNIISNTEYDFYIRTICLSGNFSTTIGPLRFSTDCSIAPNNPLDYIRNGSFECGNLGAWESIGPGDENSSCRMNFEVLQNATNVCVPIEGEEEVIPTDGFYAAYTAFNGNADDTFILKQRILLPFDLDTAPSATLSFDFKVLYQIFSENSTNERVLSINFYDTANNLIAAIAQESFGNAADVTLIDTSFDLDVLDTLQPYAGQEIVISFEAYVPETSTGPSKALIDNVSLIITKNVLSGTEELLTTKELLITPNPNNGNFELIYEGNHLLEVMILQDVTGKVVQKIDLSDFDKRKNISLQTPQPGMYFANIIFDGGIISKKLIID